MNFYEVLASKATPVELSPSETSYFSEPAAGLDPRLFLNERIKPSIRDSILSVLYTFLSTRFHDAESWTTVWLAGSGVSRQWAAHRSPADLDCLIGVDYVNFRRANSKYVGFSDQDIASALNEAFGEELNKDTANYLDTFELTFYVNVRSDIRAIKPYAAYNLTTDDWTVAPASELPKNKGSWDTKAEYDKSMAIAIIDRYQKALNQVTASTNTAARISAERMLNLAVEQGSTLFDEIHQGRKQAFSPTGEGYLDYANYRWQAGKQLGTVPALRKLKDISTASKKEYSVSTYGVELPDVSVLIRRAIK